MSANKFAKKISRLSGKKRKLPMMKYAVLPVLILLCLTAISLKGGASKPSGEIDRKARENLARFLYLSAINSDLDDKEYLGIVKNIENAYFLDRSNPEYRTLYGEMMKYEGDSSLYEKCVKMIPSSYMANPEDHFLGKEAYEFLSKNADPVSNSTRRGLAREMLKRFPDEEDLYVNLMFEYMLAGGQGDRALLDTMLSMGKRHIERNPKDPRYYFMTAVALYKADSIEAAKGVAYRVDTVFKDDPDVMLGLYQLWQSLGDSAKAEQVLDKAAALDSMNGNVWKTRAALYLSKGDTAAFVNQAFKAIQSEDIDNDTKGELLLSYMRNASEPGSENDSVEENLMITLIDENPTEPVFSYFYATWLEMRKRYSEAADYMVRVSENDTTASRDIYLACNLYNRGGNYEKAIEVATKALKETPNSYPFVSSLVASYWQQDSLGKALDIMRQSRVDTVPDPELKSNFLMMMADIYYSLEDADSAYLYYEKAIEANPHNYMALNNYAYQLSEAGKDLDKAEQMSFKTVAYDGENPIYLDTYAWILFKQIRYPEAREYIKRALIGYGENLDVEPDSISGAIDTINVTAEDLLKMVKDAAVLEPDEETDTISAEVFEHAGDIYFMNQMPELALKYWEKALELKPDKAILRRKVKEKAYFPPEEKKKKE